MREFRSLAGEWHVRLLDGGTYSASLPGTLDTNEIGHEDKLTGKLHQDENYVENKALTSADVIATRLSRKHTYEGKAVFSRRWEDDVPGGKRLFLQAERARVLRLFVDGKEIPAKVGSLSTPYVFEVTDVLGEGALIELESDNGYEGLPRNDIVYSSAATDETQTNWNGIIGEFGIEVREKTFIEGVRVYPRKEAGDGKWTLDVQVTVDSLDGFDGKIALEFEELGINKEQDVSCGCGKSSFEVRVDAEVTKELLWDEACGNVMHVSASLGDDVYRAGFGIRAFEDIDGHLCLNGRRIFLRSEANCAVFPETGHAPMDVSSWKEIIRTYMGYGVNCLRFHSHCPPEAAFYAADELGVLMQPELSHWNPRDAFSDDKSATYYENELREILEVYANHPSFVMMTFGNELQAKEDGMKVAHKLLEWCHDADKTRLFAFSSNAFYGEKGADAESDFYTAASYRDLPMRATFAGMKGYLNNDYPDAKHDYSGTVKEIRKDYQKPVFSFEVGQYEVLPELHEIEDFSGVTRARNLELIKKKVEEKGLLDEWERRVEASGELSLLSYREEVEAALRTEGYSGISLLGLQDFPGQGTALVGMMNSHLKPKPYSFAAPERFRSFFKEAIPLVLLDRYTYVDGEKLSAVVKFANYSKGDITGQLFVRVSDGEKAFLTKEFDKVNCRQGELSEVGEIEIKLELPEPKRNSELTLDVSFAGYDNSYKIYVYTRESQKPEKPDCVYECRTLDDKANEILEDGGIVFLAPDSTKEALPESVKSSFTTDFWSVGTFSSQEGTMGLLIDDEHPLFRDFPTKFYPGYQWFVQSSQRALLLPEGVRSIVTVMDCYAYLRNMGMLVEYRCKKGRIFVSSMGLHNLLDYPECRALLTAIYRYLASEDFDPQQEM
ncbi:glycoside hydrolase family 2 TIM barrel-domain containing protein [Butyrivibrio sp. NC2007]|uniref:glycoside hydrolase family 2 TIM barrel-domain containing protein n=1 Tax=Butyrivibrio sp. NC2007 TaxID=1280683 RepID=UPI0003B3DDA2|nr:glycoside hydrolase family 2 TIM barrel-domain containing protein [Butyrivibrio sp. NC2007]